MSMSWTSGLGGCALFALASAGSEAIAAETASQPYAGQQTREISSLSEKDVSDLLAGAGWGFAKAAELNGFPGPRHLLEHAEELGLSAQQIAEIERIFQAMNAKARQLGQDFVAAEAAIDAAFRAGDLDISDIEALTADSARIGADLRATHLVAHLEVRPLLSTHQIHEYNRLRGYDGETGHVGHSGH